LLPYNYVLYSSIRKSINLRLRNNIIIFDEAHNIEHDAEEAASITIPMKELMELKANTD
jgi:Rad3-related DNA helicase